MNESRIDHEVAGGVYDGRMWKVFERGFDMLQLPVLPTRWYCSYVELLPQDYYYHYAEAAEEELPAPGGITYTTDGYGNIPGLPEEMKFVGFDTNHAFMGGYTQQQAVNETIELAKLLNGLEGSSYED